VRKILRISGFYTGLILVSLLVSFYTPAILIPDAAFSQEPLNTGQSSFLPFTVDLFGPANTNRTYSGTSDIPVSFANQSLNKFITFQEAAIIFRKIFISRYVFYARNIIVRLQEADIIYPFHYFW
jgi:hypothetical protein